MFGFNSLGPLLVNILILRCHAKLNDQVYDHGAFRIRAQLKTLLP